MLALPLMDIAPGTIGDSLFYFFAVVTVGASLTVVISRNIVRTAVALLIALLGVAGLYFSLSAEFIATVQLVVYAGGTLVLIVFGVMLTNNSTFALFKPKPIELIVSLGVALLLSASLLIAIVRENFAAGRAAAEVDAQPIQRLGEALLGDFLVPFELISVLLLAVMIGAAYLAKARRREEHP